MKRRSTSSSPIDPVSLAFDLRQAIPRAHLWVVPHGGHGPVFGEAAPQFRQTARAFLRGDWGTRPPIKPGAAAAD